MGMISFAAIAERAYEVNDLDVLCSPYSPANLEHHPVKATGLINIRIENEGVFERTKEDQEYLMNNVDEGVY
jgi:hypothetical protein